MTRTNIIALAALGSGLLLAAAFAFQALGWTPCALCIWQRWPHAAAAVLGLLAVTLGWRAAPVPLLGIVAATVAAGLAIYHSGIERKWWAGPESCTGGGESLGGLDGLSLLPGAVEEVAVPMCDVLQPFLFGLTMANWNVIASLGLACLWLYALTRPAT